MSSTPSAPIPPWQRGLRTLAQVILAALVVYVPTRLAGLDLDASTMTFATAVIAGLFAWAQNHINQLPD